MARLGRASSSHWLPDWGRPQARRAAPRAGPAPCRGHGSRALGSSQLPGPVSGPQRQGTETGPEGGGERGDQEEADSRAEREGGAGPGGWVTERCVPPRPGNPGLGAGPDDSWPRAPSSPLGWAHGGLAGLTVPRHPHTAPLFAGPVRGSLWQRAWAGGKGAATSLATPAAACARSRQTGREAGGSRRQAEGISVRPACRRPAARGQRPGGALHSATTLPAGPCPCPCSLRAPVPATAER